MIKLVPVLDSRRTGIQASGFHRGNDMKSLLWVISSSTDFGFEPFFS
jgi:hypothetical protein